ncbi:hypothetical protein [Edaphobacter acidisoli]|nr:hypothetical protein [Edaphobacter acidisoli]
MDFSNDHVARVRAAKTAAQREMESFGDVSEYDVTILHGQLKEEPVVPTQRLWILRMTFSTGRESRTDAARYSS